MRLNEPRGGAQPEAYSYSSYVSQPRLSSDQLLTGGGADRRAGINRSVVPHKQLIKITTTIFQQFKSISQHYELRLKIRKTVVMRMIEKT